MIRIGFRLNYRGLVIIIRLVDCHTIDKGLTGIFQFVIGHAAHQNLHVNIFCKAEWDRTRYQTVFSCNCKALVVRRNQSRLVINHFKVCALNTIIGQLNALVAVYIIEEL